MLEDVRVLEISAPETMLAGRVLADLGADVVVVEPPAGSPGRRLEPFLDDLPGMERSLTWHALNRNKRGITLDLAAADGRDLFKTLADRFDIALEVVAPGRVAPLDNIELSSKMIRCSIAPFARSGPKSDYAASDLIVTAASGAPGMTGDRDRPPLFFPVPQAMMEGGAEAAIAALASLAARDHDGLGQHAEVSARIAAMMSAMGSPVIIGSGNPEPARSDGAFSVAGVSVPGVFECADGYMIISVAFGPAFGPMTQRLARLAADEGHLLPRIADVDWSKFPGDLARGEASPADLASLVEGVRSLCGSKTKAEMGEVARRLGLLGSPIMDMKDVAESPQYRGRGLWTKVSIGERAKQIDAPARFAQFSNFTIETTRPAPALSQHTAEILGSEIGLSRLELQALFVHGII